MGMGDGGTECCQCWGLTVDFQYSDIDALSLSLSGSDRGPNRQIEIVTTVESSLYFSAMRTPISQSKKHLIELPKWVERDLMPEKSTLVALHFG